MSDNIFKAEPQTYRFEFGCDEKIYSTQFAGVLPFGADTGILREVRKHLLEESSAIIWSYLEHNHIVYSHFSSSIKIMEHEQIMKPADFLLHSNSCSSIDEHFKETTFYYASMDYQKQFTDSHCKGCYYVIKRFSDTHNRMQQCKIIGQIFDDYRDTSQGYFAIRESRNNHLLFDIAKTSGEPIFPSFGCIDTLNLLIDIDQIKTIEQAKSAAIR